MRNYIGILAVVFIVLSCGGNNSSGGASDATAPSWISGYPLDVSPGATSASSSVKINEDGTVYYLVINALDAAPTSTQVKAGTDYSSVTVVASGFVSASANAEKILSISGLTVNTGYAVYFVAEDSSANLQTVPTVKNFSTSSGADVTAPSWNSSYPALTYVSADTVKCSVSINESGTIYYLVAVSSASSPSSTQVKTASSFGSTIVSSGSISVLKDTPTEFSVSSLSAGTGYDVWITGEDFETVPNLMSSPVKLDVSTTAVPQSTGEDFSSAAYVNGATSVSSGVWTFAVYSKNATKLILELYDSPYGEDMKYSFDLVKNTGDNTWRVKLQNLPEKFYYAFRAWGPNWPYSASWSRGNSSAGFISDVDSNGNRFNPNKVLYDPYARELSHDKSNPTVLGSENGALYGTGGISDSTSHGYSGDCTGNVNIDRRNVDTGKFAPKSVAFVDATSYGTKPVIAQKDAVIYEAHPRGLTKHSSSANLTSILSGISGFESVVNVPDAYRGTYKGAGYMAKYLKALGVTTIELLPVHETDNDNNPDDAAGGNFWGYMTYGYFAPDRRYAYDKSAGGPTKEFKEMVKAFHDEGMEVYLDVVFNHTGEGGNWDGTSLCDEVTSFRGFDNSEYYALVSSDKKLFWETTGCGNNFNAANDAVKTFIKDSLTYWITQMGVDGFRFDLAPVLGRDASPDYNFNSSATLLTDIAAFTTTYNVEMIAEAWDCQWPGGYQVSNFPAGWGEWNGFFRDVVRKYIKGEGWKVSGYPSLGDMFHGSYGPLDRSSGNTHTGFNDNGGPQKSVNFVDAHDGFTLMDLVSYGSKQNSGAWPFGASDGGSSDNDSWDSNPSTYVGGAITTGITQQELRRQQLRNIFTLLIFSRGVPMFVYGDEFGRTQNGNNNAYNLDSVATWNNYTMINTDSPTAVSLGDGFSGSYHNNFGTDSCADSKNALFLFVKNILSIRASSPALRQSDYTMSITYKKNDGVTDLSDSDKAAMIRIDGSAAGGEDYLLLINMWKAQVDFTVPSADSGKSWGRIIDTADWAEYNASPASANNFWSIADSTTVSDGSTYGVNPLSIVVLQQK